MGLARSLGRGGGSRRIRKSAPPGLLNAEAGELPPTSCVLSIAKYFLPPQGKAFPSRLPGCGTAVVFASAMSLYPFPAASFLVCNPEGAGPANSPGNHACLWEEIEPRPEDVGMCVRVLELGTFCMEDLNSGSGARRFS